MLSMLEESLRSVALILSSRAVLLKRVDFAILLLLLITRVDAGSASSEMAWMFFGGGGAV